MMHVFVYKLFYMMHVFVSIFQTQDQKEKIITVEVQMKLHDAYKTLKKWTCNTYF